MLRTGSVPAAPPGRRPAPGRPPPLSRPAVVLSLVCLALFARALLGRFVYDDELLIARNPQLHDLSRLGDLLARPLWSGVAGGLAPRPYWRPLTSLALALGYVVGAGAPAALHGLGILVHTGAVLAAFGLARRLSRSTRVAFWAALFFAVHPAQVEPVSWIAAVNDPLAALCTLVALTSFCTWRDAGRRGLPWRAGCWVLAGLLAKETAVVALPLVLLLARWRPAAALARDLAPFAAAALVYYLLRAAVFGGAGAGLLPAAADAGLDAGRLLALRVELLAAYLGRLVLPAGAQLFPEVRAQTEVLPFLGALAAVAALAAAVWAARRRAPLRFALLAIPLTLLPPLALTGAVGPFAFADRYLYLGCFGFGLGLALVLRHRAVKALLATAAAVLTFTGIGRWHDRITLFTQAVAASPGSITAHYELGRAQLRRYVSRGDPTLLRAARSHFDAAGDRFEEGRRGAFVLSQTQPVDVEIARLWCRLYEARLGADPDFEPIRTAFARIARSHPRHAQASTGLGVALALEGRDDAAEAALAAAVALAPHDPEAHHNLGNLLLRRGRPDRAVAEVEAAHAIDPGNDATRALLVRARLAQAVARGRAGNLDAALRSFDRAIDLGRRPGPIWLQRAKLCAAGGRDRAAERSYRVAADLLPRSFEAAYGLGSLLARGPAPAAALPWLERALALYPRSGKAVVSYEALQRAIAALAGR